MTARFRHYEKTQHEHASIEGTACNGCRCMCVMIHERYMFKPVEFWCDRRHGMVDPHGIECDYGKSSGGN